MWLWVMTGEALLEGWASAQGLFGPKRWNKDTDLSVYLRIYLVPELFIFIFYSGFEINRPLE